MPTATDTMRLQLRWLVQRDMPDVLDCERFAYGRWSESSIRNELRHRDVIGIVAYDLTLDRVVGYTLYRICPRSLDVLRLAVIPEHRGQGVGRQLVVHVARKLDAMKRDALTVQVHERDVSMQLFLRAVGLAYERTTPGDEDGDCYQFVFWSPM